MLTQERARNDRIQRTQERKRLHDSPGQVNFYGLSDIKGNSSIKTRDQISTARCTMSRTGSVEIKRFNGASFSQSKLSEGSLENSQECHSAHGDCQVAPKIKVQKTRGNPGVRTTMKQ